MTSNATDKTSQRLNVGDALEILNPNGPLGLSLKGFEPRAEQKEMMRNILDAYNRSEIALIEAGTGTGKSLAYLIPAMLWAAQTKERTVISTNTIPLQEQLLFKDIPLIEQALDLNVKAVLVKGMHNYLCLRKLEEVQQESLLLSPQEDEELQKIYSWKNATEDGSRSSLSFAPSHGMWDKLAAESDTCNRNSCPYFQQCYFFKARRQASEAQILIVNHHLLFADLVCRTESENFKEAGILPNYSRIILDEAHNIEDIATEYFASRVSQMDVMRVMARLTSEKGGKVHGKLPLIKEKLIKLYRNDTSHEILSLHNRLNLDLPAMRRDLLQQTHEIFNVFYEFVRLMQGEKNAFSEEQSQGEMKLRILPPHQSHNYWKEKLIPIGKQLIDSFKRYIQMLSSLESDLKLLKNTQLDEQIKGILFEIGGLAHRLQGCAAAIEKFIGDFLPTLKVRWIEIQQLKNMINTSIVDADLDISKTLAEYLFSKFSTVVLCSATLTTDKKFHFIRNRLGLNQEMLKHRQINEYAYNSPFNFVQQALLLVPKDLPNPSEPSFIEDAAEKIFQVVLASRGNAFILFTSYSMLKSCFQILENRLKEHRFNLLKQGDDNRQQLLNNFKKNDRSILFGTDSFWEGVDVVGDALRCVIIVKLPFKVPSDPLIEARSQAIVAQGGDSFMDYSLPQAIVKFKQGFGRLIRNRRDRGCIVCLDNRIITKRYGRLFLSSLPDCQQVFCLGSEIQKVMTDFYKRTHFLVCNPTYSTL